MRKSTNNSAISLNFNKKKVFFFLFVQYILYICGGFIKRIGVE